MYASPPPMSASAGMGTRSLVRYDLGRPEATTVLGPEHFPDNPDGSGGRSPWIDIALTPDGRLVLADGWDYRIRLLGPEAGETVREFGRQDLDRPHKSEKELERAREALRRMRRDDEEPDPESPHFFQATVDGAGRLWLATLREPGGLDVLSSETGDLLAELSVGHRISPGGKGVDAAGDRLVAVTLDDLDTAIVRIFRIVQE